MNPDLKFISNLVMQEFWVYPDPKLCNWTFISEEWRHSFVCSVADLYYVTWFPLDNPEDIRARDINGDVETEGLGRTVRSVIEGLRQDHGPNNYKDTKP